MGRGRNKQIRKQHSQQQTATAIGSSVVLPEKRRRHIMELLAGWGVVAVLVPILIGVGIGVLSMAPPEFTIAKVCFTTSAILLVVKTG